MNDKSRLAWVLHVVGHCPGDQRQWVEPRVLVYAAPVDPPDTLYGYTLSSAVTVGLTEPNVSLASRFTSFFVYTLHIYRVRYLCGSS